MTDVSFKNRKELLVVKRDYKDMFEKCKYPSSFLSIFLEESFLEGKLKETFDSYYYSFIKNFDQRMRENYDSQLKEISELTQKPNYELLEIGCGCGSESLWLASRGVKVLGVDISEEKVKVAEERKRVLEEILGRNLPCKFERSSILDLDEKQYDFIWLEQAFHHIEPRKDFFKKIRNLLKRKGFIVFSESNAWNPLIQLGLFRLRGFQTILKEEVSGRIYHYGNERIITPYQLKKHLVSSDFKVKSIRYFRIFPNRSYFNRFRVFERNFPKYLKPFFTHYNLVAQKN